MSCDLMDSAAAAFSPYCSGLFIWGTDLLHSMDHLFQPTLSWGSGSAQPTDPVCEVVAIVTSHLFSSGFGRMLNKMVQRLQD